MGHSEILFNSLKANPRPLFVANPDIVAPHENLVWSLHIMYRI